jgi:hypothetical protein
MRIRDIAGTVLLVVIGVAFYQYNNGDWHAMYASIGSIFTGAATELLKLWHELFGK